MKLEPQTHRDREIGPQVGMLAPDFELPCTRTPRTTDGIVRFSDFRGRWLVVMFYPRDFSLVCPTELAALSARLGEFQDHGCEILGISCDTVETHEKWVATPKGQGGLGGLGFPLASDADGVAARAFRVFQPFQRVALRGLFILDPNGVIQYEVVHNLSVGRRIEEVLRIVAALQSGGLCAEDWTAKEDPLDPTRVLGPGSVVGLYQIESKIGAGAFAAVYRAYDRKLDRRVALKVLKPNTRIKPEDALEEARAAAALSHPNVCTIYAVDDEEGVPIIAMEHLEGRTLAEMLASGKPLDLGRTRVVGQQIALAIAAAHAANIVHGDLKPANIFVTRQETVKVLDFGLARRGWLSDDPESTVDLNENEFRGLSGTPSYMAPEQTQGAHASQASDVFALGLVLYEMLSGRRAFGGDNLLLVLDRIRRIDAETLAAPWPPPFRDVLKRALAKRPQDRSISMEEIADILRGPDSLAHNHWD